MFESKARPINLTQYEHGRLCGVLASCWGNERFQKPALPFDPFVTAVTLHDWHYELIDNVPIGKASDEAWLEVTRKGVEYRHADPIVDILTRLHLKRLLNFGIHVTDEVPELLRMVEDRVVERLPETNHSRAEFEGADLITRLCDFLTFDLHFEKPVSRNCQIFADGVSEDEVAITHAITGPGQATVDPWPFNIPVIEGVLIGFERDGYPADLKPVVIPYTIRQEEKRD